MPTLRKAARRGGESDGFRSGDDRTVLMSVLFVNIYTGADYDRETVSTNNVALLPDCEWY